MQRSWELGLGAVVMDASMGILHGSVEMWENLLFILSVLFTIAGRGALAHTATKGVTSEVRQMHF